MAQGNKVCKICGEPGHSKFYCKNKPIKTIKVKSPFNGVSVFIDGKRISNQTIGVVKNLPKSRKKPPETRSKLVKKLDSVFSQYIRLKDAVDGQATCVTCGDTKPWKEMQNGHFYTRGRYPTRWDEDNCHVQDYRCNVIFNGNYIKYTMYMIDRYGKEVIDALEAKSLSGTKISTPDLREMIEDYKKKVELLNGTK